MAAAEEGDTAKQVELGEFHEVLDDVAHGRDTPRVQKFLVEAFVRGAAPELATARQVPLEGATAVFSRRRDRNRWNRAVLKRIAKRGGRV